MTKSDAGIRRKGDEQVIITVMLLSFVEEGDNTEVWRIESHVNLRVMTTRPGLDVKQTCLDTGRKYQEHVDLEGICVVETVV